jgi:hypothetical protein
MFDGEVKDFSMCGGVGCFKESNFEKPFLL